MRRFRGMFLGPFLLGLPLMILGQTATKKLATNTAAPKHAMVGPGDVKWGPPPEGLFVGQPSVEANGQAEFAVLEGDLSKAGAPYVTRAKCSDGFRFAPHWHPAAENVTVLQGALRLGLGDKWDDAAMHESPAGGFFYMPARVHHFAGCKGDTVLQVHGIGPFQVIYVGAKPAPAKKGK